LDSALAPLGLSPELTGGAVARALACAVAHSYVFTDPADTALLNQLDPGSAASGEPLEALGNEKLLAPPGTPPAGPAPDGLGGAPRPRRALPEQRRVGPAEGVAAAVVAGARVRGSALRQ